jgi:hypothetical protein
MRKQTPLQRELLYLRERSFCEATLPWPSKVRYAWVRLLPFMPGISILPTELLRPVAERVRKSKPRLTFPVIVNTQLFDPLAHSKGFDVT